MRGTPANRPGVRKTHTVRIVLVSASTIGAAADVLRKEAYEFVLEVPEPEEPTVRVSAECMVPKDLLGYLIPMISFAG